MRPLTLFALVAALAACSQDDDKPAAPPSVDPDLLRTTGAGDVIGFRDKGVLHWRGIAYAAPPVKDLRWRAPQPPAPHEIPLEANLYRPVCKQVAHVLGEGSPEEYGMPVGEEDCLYLNIVAPENASGPVPVMVWIHGGGNMVGSASAFDFSTLAKKEQVIVVSIAYRLGIFGWFAQQRLREAAPDELDQSPNFGLLDQLAALQWVQQNIRAFGGDPERITIFGESAGGHNVLALLSSPLSGGLVHRAIAQSGATRSVSLERAEAKEPGVDGLLGSEFLISRWVEDHPPDALPLNDEIVANQVTAVTGDPMIEDPVVEQAVRYRIWLQLLDADYILGSLYTSKTPDFSVLPNVARIIEDDIVIAKAGLKTALLERSFPVPLIVGTNKDELRLFLALDEELVDNWFGFQYWIRDRKKYARLSDYPSMAWKESGADGIAAEYPWPSWVYRFDWDEEPSILLTDFGELFGASHAFEIPFVSGSMSLRPSIDRILFDEENLPTARLLSEKMMSYWAEFARTGAPGEGGARAGDTPLPLWELYRLHGSFMVFDTESGGGLRMERDLKNMDDLFEQLASDEAITEDAERCGLAWSLLSFSGLKSEQMLERYRAWQSGLCADMEVTFR